MTPASGPALFDRRAGLEGASFAAFCSGSVAGVGLLHASCDVTRSICRIFDQINQVTWEGETAMAEFDTNSIEDGQIGKRLSPEIEREIQRAIGRIDYGSVEVVIHDGKVVQIECREKIRVVRDEPGRKSAIRQIR
jgi:hypothetical protein